ncbi:hypothetical protein VOLCADRAFT_105757 [Volvox carteri f. nagariensis]|uniref:Uncharacterized protein n=1 Tax=Volvox carteri f. nagariensis TaxID=3068 RepID=D8U2V7_VOLCA|nr:uncharacterized protein VOLCADRAFT_105757 [Volvox carteri f. nagariensis]EFJ45964.1 hypothetical protein VOLCADRAFT_105757 [Volvox carteri f. nagariensis]|eukprot:XP_002953042.1 hypothetical protein VOLCADRAFT_105757 [Volvox carteri f. nagariensis]
MEGDRNDLRNSTLTLYYQQRSQSARPMPARVPAGPGARLIGSVHTHVYDERPSLAKIPGAGGDGPSTSGAASAGLRSTGGSLYRTKKVVYWTGRDHHIVDAPDVPDSQFEWHPPHLKQGDVAPGPQLAVRETPGASRIKLIGSKYRYLPTMEPGSTSMWAVSPEEANLYGSVGSNTWGASGIGGPPTGPEKPRPLTAVGPLGAQLDIFSKQRVMGYKDHSDMTDVSLLLLPLCTVT